MNWVDAVIVLVLVLYAVRGWRRGFLSIAIGLSGLIVSLVFAALLYRPLTPLLEALGIPRNFAIALSFILLWILAQVIFSAIVRRYYRRIPRGIHRSPVNRAAGIVPGVLEGIILVALVGLLLVALPSPVLPGDNVLESRLGRPLVEHAAVLTQHAANVFAGAIQDALAFITIEPDPTSPERMDLPFQTTDVDVNLRAEERMLDMVNRERRERQLPELTLDPQLRAVARDHSRDMFARGYFSHVNPDGQSPFDRMREGNITFVTAGENLALAPTVEMAHNGLMNSPGHRANILAGDFGRVGIGAVTHRIHGTMYTQLFRD